MSDPELLLLTSAVARVLKVDSATVRWLEKTGKLSAQRTTSGTRLFRREDVEALKALRRKKHGTTMT